MTTRSPISTRWLSRSLAAPGDAYEIANWHANRDSHRGTIRLLAQCAYAAFGAGAHGRIGNERFMNHLKPATYIDAIASGLRPIRMPKSVARIADGRNDDARAALAGRRGDGGGVPDSPRRRADRSVRAADRRSGRDGPPGLGRPEVAPDGAGTLLANDVCSRFCSRSGCRLQDWQAGASARGGHGGGGVPAFWHVLPSRSASFPSEPGLRPVKCDNAAEKSSPGEGNPCLSRSFFVCQRTERPDPSEGCFCPRSDGSASGANREGRPAGQCHRLDDRAGPGAAACGR